MGWSDFNDSCLEINAHGRRWCAASDWSNHDSAPVSLFCASLRHIIGTAVCPQRIASVPPFDDRRIPAVFFLFNKDSRWNVICIFSKKRVASQYLQGKREISTVYERPVTSDMMPAKDTNDRSCP